VKSPPSERLSGVKLRTPITSGREIPIVLRAVFQLFITKKAYKKKKAKVKRELHLCRFSCDSEKDQAVAGLFGVIGGRIGFLNGDLASSCS
ncbi:hypothetical protein OFO05_31265, partial [Escherichia coli]|nr:hypothetical protein [Escherichia coli]